MAIVAEHDLKQRLRGGGPRASGHGPVGMSCDLHVHSCHSGPAGLPVLGQVGKECYSDPLAVHERARERGMDLVTITDHDTIEGALRLSHLPGTFVSEEVTMLLPGGRQLHLNVFDITEAQHQAIQLRRRDPEALLAWLAENEIASSVNHLFAALTGERQLADLRLALGRLSLIETRNGAMPAAHNWKAGLVGRSAGMAAVGGSDAHSLAHVARAFTSVPGARTKQQFLDGLRCGLTIPRGRSGSYARLTSEVTHIFGTAYREAAGDLLAGTGSLFRLVASALLVPFLPLLPVFTLAVYAHELAFGRRLFAELQRERGGAREAPLPTALAHDSLEEAA
jgi:predicted metal-dependent phosphoesterase TrpH